jgi:diketogulonate reductase-like aldo/keto reductase
VSEEALQETWRDMERCLEKGLARNIGVSNFLIPHLETILKVARVKPAVNQIELHPYLQRRELVQFLKSHNISVEAFAPLTPLVKARPGPVDEVCRRLAEKHGVSASIVLLRWVLDQGIIAITTSGRKDRLQEYLSDVASFQLAAEEVKAISVAGEGKNYRGFYVDDYGANCFL